MWQAALTQALSVAAQAAAGGPSNAENGSNLTPTIGGEFNVNFGGTQDVGGRSTGGPSAGLGLPAVSGNWITYALIGGIVLLVVAMVPRRK